MAQGTDHQGALTTPMQPPPSQQQASGPKFTSAKAASQRA
jgi:hypothetical protein